MAGSGHRVNRRAALAALACISVARPSLAFGQGGIFQARSLLVGGRRLAAPRDTALDRWAAEVVRRTSAPARLSGAEVAADAPALMGAPFVIWSGAAEFPPLTAAEVNGLARFLKLGGLLMVDDAEPESGAFGRCARRELARVLPEQPVVRLDGSHVVYKSYFIVERPVGRVLGPPYLEGIVRGRIAQVILSSHDLLGALARAPGGNWAFDVTPRGLEQREQATRLAVNIALYLLCSDYKDDQVHAPWLMRRRAGRRP